MKTIKTAHQIARKYGTTKATKIIVGDDSQVLRYVQPGYYKYTTGERVSNAYRNNFGWKNTSYHCAICEVMVNIENFY